jgi:predicted hydrolase (HD superfamily)
MNSPLHLDRQTFGDPSDTDNVLTREQASALLQEWVKNDRLRLHMEQVGHLMQCWAREKEQLGAQDQWRWEMAGLLHDADWDQWPEEHCRRIIEELERRHIDPEVIRAIASHGPAHFGVEPVTRMDKMLYAFDELSGLIHAYSLMRPGGYDGMELKGVLKRLKEKTFAAGVSREDIADACAKAAITQNNLIEFILAHQGRP